MDVLFENAARSDPDLHPIALRTRTVNARPLVGAALEPAGCLDAVFARATALRAVEIEVFGGGGGSEQAPAAPVPVNAAPTISTIAAAIVHS